MLPAARVETVDVRHIFTLSGLGGVALAGQTVENVMSLGRFEVHTRNRPDTSIRVWVHEIPASRLQVTIGPNGDGLALADVNLQMQVWRDRNGIGQVHLVEAVPPDFSVVARRLRTFCHDRVNLRFNGFTLTEFVQRILQLDQEPVLEQDVLQVVHSADLSELENSASDPLTDAIASILYREESGMPPEGLEAFAKPRGLNLSRREIGIHGRGVLVLAGHDRATVDVITLTSAELLFASSRARLTRRQLEGVLRQVRGARGDSRLSTADLRALVRRVRDSSVDLAVDVNAFADGHFMPELVVDSFRRTFSERLRLSEVASSTAALAAALSEVTSFLLQQEGVLGAAVAEARDRRWRLVVAITSGIAIPIAFLFSYFGVSSEVNAPPGSAITDLTVYWVPYAATIATILAIVILSTRQYWSRQ